MIYNTIYDISQESFIHEMSKTWLTKQDLKNNSTNLHRRNLIGHYPCVDSYRQLMAVEKKVFVFVLFVLFFAFFLLMVVTINRLLMFPWMALEPYVCRQH